jgi:hypothetical protein
MNYIRANADGRITGYVEAPHSDTEPDIYIPQPDETAIADDDVNPTEMLFKGGKLVAKAQFPQTFNHPTVRANGSDESVITGLPKGTEIEVAGSTFAVVDDGSAHLVFTEPGTYTVRVDPFPYKPFEVTIDAH